MDSLLTTLKLSSTIVLITGKGSAKMFKIISKLLGTPHGDLEFSSEKL